MALVYSETVVHSSIFFSDYRTMRNYLDWKKKKKKKKKKFFND